jgi:hypothetical protein
MSPRKVTAELRRPIFYLGWKSVDSPRNRMPDARRRSYCLLVGEQPSAWDQEINQKLLDNWFTFRTPCDKNRPSVTEFSHKPGWCVSQEGSGPASSADRLTDCTTIWIDG